MAKYVSEGSAYMDTKRKVAIVVTTIAVVGIMGGITYKLTTNSQLGREERNPSTTQTQKPIINEDQDEDREEEPDFNDTINPSEKEEEEDNSNISKEEEVTTPSQPGKKPRPTKKPVVPGITTPKPTEPEKPVVTEPPTIPDNKDPEESEHFVISNDMIQAGTFTMANKKYNTITVRSDIPENTKIILNGVEVSGGVILEAPKNYQLNIQNSNVASLAVTAQSMSIRSYSMRSRAVADINKTLEGATVNLDAGSVVQSISIDSNIQVNGTNTANAIAVNSGSEVVLNIPSRHISLNTQGVVAINKSVNTLTNSGYESTVIINAPVASMTNNESSTIRLNNGNTITNFRNQGSDTVVSGNGTITNPIIAANNTRIYTNVTNTPVLAEAVENVLVRKETQTEITNAYSNAQGSVTFTLSAPTNLTINDISVICNAGKSISLFKLTTTDNQTYTLSTSYYKNDSYALYITLPNGNIVSKDFDTDYANPTVNKVVVERISDTDATLELYGVDEGGHIYYVLEEKTTRETITASSIKEKGASETVKVGYNKVSIKGLEAGKSYNLYYVIEGYFENTSKVKGPFEVSSQVKVIDPSNYQIVYAKEEIENRFVFTLNKAPEKELTLSDFEIICPQEKNLTTSGAKFIVSPDRLTYILIVPDNYGHNDNKYTVKIKVSETEVIEGSFVSHFNPPVITGAVDNVIRTGENTAEFTFNSDEEGTVYYGVYEWNGAIYDYNSTTPFANDVLTGAIQSNKQVLNAGPNTIHIDLTGIPVNRNTRVWALFIDTVGNYRVGFVDHYKLPEYVPPVDPDVPDGRVQITNFTVRNNKNISIDFSETIGWVTSSDVELSVVSGGSLPSQLLYSIDNDTPKHLGIDIMNYTLPTGKYKLTIRTQDADENAVVLTKEFEIN